MHSDTSDGTRSSQPSTSPSRTTSVTAFTPTWSPTAADWESRPAWLTARTAPQQPEKIAVAADRRFNLVDARDASGLDLDVEASDVRGVAHDLAPQQPDTPEHAARGR